MNMHNITFDDMSNGPGLRVVLWVSGCSHQCKQCHNPQTWDCSSGIPFTSWEEAEFFEKVSKKHIAGVTFSGGDPLHENNRDEVGRLVSLLKELYPLKDIILYTGYTMSWNDNIKDFQFSDDVANLKPFSIGWLSKVDIIVDGRFDYEQRQVDLIRQNDITFRGSSNQRYIDVSESLKRKNVVLYPMSSNDYSK